MKQNFFVKNYSACWKFFCGSRWYIVFALGIFALTFLVGFIFPIFFREEIFSFIAELIESVEGKSVVELIWFIFLNNLKASFMAIVLGIAFGVFPLVTAIVNGYLIGFVAREAVAQEGLFVMWQLFPHGIFELPAVIFSIGIGMKIGMSLLHKLHQTYFRKNLSFLSFFILCIFIFPISIPILLIFFFYFLYSHYMIHYIRKKRYIFLILSILIQPIMIFNLAFNNELKTFWNEDFVEGLRFFILVVLPLLLVAGIIEGILIWILG